MGGVQTGRDALELIAAGARHVALGTVLFADPDAPSRVRAELAAAANDVGVVHPDELFALAHAPLDSPQKDVESGRKLRA